MSNEPKQISTEAAVSIDGGSTGGSGRIKWSSLLKHNDVLLAVGMVMVVGMMIIPLPAFMLDILLTINIALAVTTLLVTLYTQETLEYSTFPTILLIATLFRLGLNVSSTRLILAEGQAGSVITSFGNFVIGGNYVVGLLIFIILVIINFIVITNGAGRVSEVAARFTLDAMPGKQLSIDADLNSGNIDEKQARTRRSQVQREADFYGTMDGASKFVKGDAIAGIIVTVINIIGGLIIGVIQMKMPIMEAASTFTTLTVGDGLVSQIPALLISSATGILVTRVGSDENSTSLGDDISTQMFNNPKVMGIVAGMMLLMAFMPGLPTLPFLLIAVMAGGAGYFVYTNKKADDVKTEEDAQALQLSEKTEAKKENILDLLQIEPLELEMGYRLVPLIEAESGGDLLERIGQIRRQMATEMGFVLPSIRVRDNLQLGPTHYQINLRGTTIETGDVMPDMWLAMVTDPDLSEPLENAIPTKEPAFGMDAFWIHAEQKEVAESNGYTVVSASAVMSTHLTEVLKRHSAEILSQGDTHELLERVKETNEGLVTDLIPDELSIAEVHMILESLLRESVSIRDMETILESISYHVRVQKDLNYLTEQCRIALSRQICKQHQHPEKGNLPVITLSPELEEKMAQGLMEDGSLVISPAITQQLIQSISTQVEQVISNTGFQPSILCSSQLRLGLRRLLERPLGQIAVMSYNEIGPSTKVNSLSTIRIETNKAPQGAA